MVLQYSPYSGLLLPSNLRCAFTGGDHSHPTAKWTGTFSELKDRKMSLSPARERLRWLIIFAANRFIR